MARYRDDMTDAPTPIRVFLLDDHEIVRRGIKELLEGEPDIEVVVVEQEDPDRGGRIGHVVTVPSHVTPRAGPSVPRVKDLRPCC